MAIINGTSGNDTLTGTTSADSLFGGAGNDSLNAGDGNDTLIGGLGADTLNGGTGTDTADYNASSAAVTVSLATNTGSGGDAQGDLLSSIENLVGSAFNDTLTGNTGANRLEGGSGTDSLFGGGGNDTLAGGADADRLDGGTGTDWAEYATSTAAVNVNLTTGNGLGGDAQGDILISIEALQGSAFNDTLTGNGSNNTLSGGLGDDALFGAAGTDQLFGGDGQDTLFGGSGSDLIDGGTGIDTADYSASTAAVNVNLATGTGSGGDAGTDTLTGVENLAGSGFNDTLTGSDANNFLSGGAGNDSINAGRGDDTLSGGAGADTLTGGEGMDYLDYSASGTAININLGAGTATGGDATGDVLNGVDGIIGSQFNDTLIGFDNQGFTGDVYTNVLYGAGGNDFIDGRGSADILYGGTGNDTVLGGAGEDLVAGDDGDDALDGGSGADSLYGGDGADSLDGGADADQLDGGAGNDTLLGGLGGDTLQGGTGNDQLFGGDGADILSGGDGSDTLYGGAGTGSLFGGEGDDVITSSGGNDIAGGNGSDLFFIGRGGDTVDGDETGTEIDRLDLTGLGRFKIIRDPLNPENGTINFLDMFGVIQGTAVFRNIEQIIACFTPGTLIATAKGPVAVQALQPGDQVITRDHGLQTLRWVGSKSLDETALAADPTLLPILIRKDALGPGAPARDMMVSRQHRMMLTGPRAELLFGADEVLVRAAHLLHLPGVSEMAVSSVTYVHILFDRHELVLADDAWSESFQPGERTLNGLDSDARDELAKLFPDLITAAGPDSFPSVRTTLKSHEARVLLTA